MDEFFFFFFKQKTAYGIASCLVGSEMWIRDRTVVQAIDAMRDAGRTVIVIAPRAAMMEAADAVIDVRSAADEEAHA